MSTTIIRPKDRAEWLEHRKKGIGSSEVATILGLNPRETPYQLWRRKMGLDTLGDETFAMKAAYCLEDAVARFWADATGREVIEDSAADWLVVNNDRDFLRVSPDRTFRIPGLPESRENRGVLACKTTRESVDPDDLPKDWFCEVQYLLGVSELTQGALAWLCRDGEFGCRDIAFVPDFYDWMVGEVERFWVDNILGGAEPPVMSVADVTARYACRRAGCGIGASDEMQALLRLREVREGIARAEAERERLEAKINAEAEWERLETKIKAEAERERLEAKIKAEAERERLEAKIKAGAEWERLETKINAEAERERLEAKIKAGAGNAGAIGCGGQRLAVRRAGVRLVKSRGCGGQRLAARRAGVRRVKSRGWAFRLAHPGPAREFTRTIPGIRRFILK